MMKYILTTLLLFISAAANAIVLATHTHYLIYNLPDAPAEGFYNFDMHIKWHKEPDVGRMGFYAQFAFRFQAHTGGYMGLQQDQNEGKKAIFSIWDVSGRQTAIPLTANCKRFDHEDTGVSCLVPFNWKAGHEYKLRLWRISDTATREKWGGWVIDYITGEETLIGIVEVLSVNGLVGYGGLINGPVTTLEFYGAPGENGIPCNQLPYFGATWSGPFSNNGSRLPQASRVQYFTGVGTPCAANVNVASNSPFNVTAETGGNIKQVTTQNTNVWDKHNYQYFVEIECLFNWGERNYPNLFDQSVFAQRRLSKSIFGYYVRDYTHNGKGYGLIVDTNNNRLIMGDLGGAMQDIGDLEHWKRSANCKR